ncbi:MAG: DUF2157 domain-containing protein [Hydrococcus sp. Prado102]|jgi:uncharacterized membrane protein|nr:DUF2157 domain-containing protein [Hydrococcus sp. Prado102]
MVSEKFRHQLRQEVMGWQAEGLIDEELYAELARRYQFADLADSARNRFVAILIGLGSVLLGLAAITFVAANWQVLSKPVKVVLLMSLFAGVNAAGFYLWRPPAPSWQARLGKGLLLFGSSILGANFALMSQIFHQSGSVYQLFLVWGLGVLAMAYSLRLTFLGILALILTGIGYGSGIMSFLIPREVSGFQLAIAHMPLLVSLLGIPLAYWCRSRWLFGLSAVLIVASLEVNLLIFLADFSNYSPTTRGITSAIATSLPPALLWAYRDSLWNISLEKLSFDAIARNLSLIFISTSLYFFSFNWWDARDARMGSQIELSDWFGLIDLVFLSAVTIWAWWRLGFLTSNTGSWRLERQSTLIGAVILVSGTIVGVDAFGAIATLIFNILLFLFAVAFIRRGLATGNRRGFWGGLLLLVLQIASRMLEYETNLLAKAIALFICGFGIIGAGLWFERHLHTLNTNTLGSTHDQNNS